MPPYICPVHGLCTRGRVGEWEGTPAFSGAAGKGLCQRPAFCKMAFTGGFLQDKAAACLNKDICSEEAY